MKKYFKKAVRPRFPKYDGTVNRTMEVNGSLVPTSWLPGNDWPAYRDSNFVYIIGV